MGRKRLKLRTVSVILPAIAFGITHSASASPITPGFDFFTSKAALVEAAGDTIVERKHSLNRGDDCLCAIQ